MAGRYDNPMPESTISPSQGLRIGPQEGRRCGERSRSQPRCEAPARSVEGSPSPPGRCVLRGPCHSVRWTCLATCSQILSPWLGGYSRLWQRVVVPFRQVTYRLASRYDNLMPESTISPRQRTKNLSSGRYELWGPCSQCKGIALTICHMGIKNAVFNAEFESVEKVRKKLLKKSYRA